MGKVKEAGEMARKAAGRFGWVGGIVHTSNWEKRKAQPEQSHEKV